jgi:hypothetical protein
MMPAMKDKNAFMGMRDAPTDAEVAAVLGPATKLWDALIALLARHHGVVDQEWKSVSPKYGWSLRLKQQKRTIAYLSPCTDSFIVSIVLGDRAVQAARGKKLPRRILKALKGAPRYAEGTGVRMLVKKLGDIGAVEKLIAAKLGN